MNLVYIGYKMVNPSPLIQTLEGVFMLLTSITTCIPKMTVDCSFTNFSFIDIACKRLYCPGALYTTGQQSLATRACLYKKGV